MNPEQRLHVLTLQIQVEHDGVKRQLEGRLRDLEHEIARARKDLEAGRPISSNIVTNAGVDELVARWNLVRQLMPSVKGE